MKLDSVAARPEGFPNIGKADQNHSPAQQKTALGRRRLAAFFSHPTQHHSALFQYLAKNDDIEVQVFYYDPGSLGGMFDPGYGNNAAWDVDLTTGVQSRVLKNVLRGKAVHPFRQLNPGVFPAVLKGRFHAIFLSGYAAPSNWLVLAAARLTGSAIWYQSDTNILDLKRKSTSRFKDLLRKTFLRSINTFLVAGDNNKSTYDLFGIPDEKMTWCPIPVDMARYQAARSDAELPQKLDELRSRYGIPGGARVVAFCGKLIERKRPQDLIEALRILNRPDTYGLLIGSGEMAAALKESLTAQDRIVITGFVNQSEIPYHMLLADVGVVSSEWDPHPLVTTEFAMCGRPVVVSDYCGVWGSHDILRPDENGFLYRCGDIGELAGKISRLLADDNLRSSMGQRSLVFAADQSAEHAAGVFADLLRR
jgi:glycosyltransferase involved in cell wall biosynthesis